MHSIVENSSKILLFLVNDLMDFTQIKNGKFKKNEVPVNIRESVSDMIEIVNLALVEKGLTLHYECREEVPLELMTDG